MALSRERVVREALALTDERGLEALSLRTLAARLGVQAPTLYWHVKNKSELLDAVSDAIMAEALEALALPGEGDAEVRGGDEGNAPGKRALVRALFALRAAMLGHRDGARIVSGARDSLARVEFTEAATVRLAHDGMSERAAWLLVLTGTRYTLGHVLAEQGPDAAPSAAVDAEFRRRFPVVAREAVEYFASNSSDDLFEDAVRQLTGVPPRGGAGV